MCSKMFTRRIPLLAVMLIAVYAHKTCAETTNDTKGIIPNPIEIAKWQIEKLIGIITNLVELQFKILDDIRKTVASITENSINNTIKMIDIIINGTVGRMRRILQDAIDKGINITECYVLNMDKLRILRRHLIIDEIQCVTSQAGEFYNILDGATKNFTNDLGVVLDLPNKLKKCIITITPITCVTKIIDEITDLQKAIPQQILGTMVEIADYLDGFDQRVHKCQFAALREAIIGTREIVDNLLECVRYGEIPAQTSDDSIAETAQS